MLVAQEGAARITLNCVQMSISEHSHTSYLFYKLWQIYSVT